MATDGVACIDCRHFQQTGLQNSGILLPDKSGPWFYEVGTCALAAENTRNGFVQPGGYPGYIAPLQQSYKRLGLPNVDDPRVVSWGECYLGRRRRGKQP